MSEARVVSKKEAKQAHFSRNAAVFAMGTLLSRVLGMARDIVNATQIPEASFGAFNIAFRLPNMFRELIGEGAANAAFIPVLSETQEKRDDAAFRELVGVALGNMLVVLAAMTALGVAFVHLPLAGADQLMWLTGAKKLDPAYVALTMSVARWTFPYLFFIGVAVFMMGPLFAVRHYATPSWTPSLLNVALILASMPFILKRFPDPAYALALGVWVGGISHVVINWIAMGKHTGVWMPVFRFNHPDMRRIYLLLVPVLIGQSANEVNKLIDLMFANSLGPGAVNALYLGNRLTQLPLAMFGMAVSAAILPRISRAGARGAHDEMRATLMQGLRFSFFLIAPSMLGLIALREPIMRLLFEYGVRTNAQTTLDAAAALAYFSTGLLAFAWVKVTVGGFYALLDTKTPVKIATASILLNILLNAALIKPMGFRGLALATTISFTVNFALLYLMLCSRIGRLWDRNFLEGLGKMTFAAIIMACVAYGVYVRVHIWWPQDTVLMRLAGVALPIATAAAVYGAICKAMGIGELDAVWQMAGRGK